MDKRKGYVLLLINVRTPHLKNKVIAGILRSCEMKCVNVTLAQSIMMKFKSSFTFTIADTVPLVGDKNLL
jgi:hypothetical protein